MAGGRLKYYIDLIAVVILVGLCILFILFEPFNETPLRILFSFILLLFLPGYALIAAMFPKMSELSGIERFTLSVGLSMVITVFDGFAISVTPYLFRPTPLTLTLSTITVFLLLVTVITRTLTLEDGRYFVDYRGFIESLRADDEKMSDIERMLFIALIGSIIIASSMLTYAKLTFEDEEFSALYILGPDGKAEGYQKNFHIGEPGTIAVGVENYEHAATDYMLQVKLGTGVLETRKITLAHKEKWIEDITFVPDRTGDRLKLEFVLYKDGKSYRSVHLWVNSSINYDDTSSLLNYLIVPPDIQNGGMEKNSSWKFRSNRNFTGNYSNVSHSSNHSYEIVSVKPDEGWYGEISQEIVSPKPGLAVLRFAVRDSILTNTTGYMLQVLLNDAIVWEGSTAKDEGWQWIRCPVMLQNVSQLTLRVYSRVSNPAISVWWDDVEFETLTMVDMAYYDPSVILGTPTDVSVVIENYEPAYTNYTLALKLGGELVAERDATIKSCTKSTWNLTFTPRMIGSHLPLEFLLYRDGAVYRYDVKTVSSSIDYSDIDFVMDYSITPPRIHNYDMEYNGHWEYTGKGNFTGNYTTTTSTRGHRSYEIAILENSSTIPDDFGAISQEITSNKGIVLLTFNVRDSQTSDTEGRYKKQVLLSGSLIWEDDASGDEGWQHVKVPVMLASNNTLTLRAYGGTGGTDFQIWWDNVKFTKFEGEVESETKVAGSVSSMYLSGIPMPINANNTITLTESNCDQLNSDESLALYFSENGVVEPGDAAYNISVRRDLGIHYLGKKYTVPGLEPDILLPIIVDGRSRTLCTNKTWELGEGHNLSLRGVDTAQDIALLELSRNNEILDSGVAGVGEMFEYRTDVKDVGDDVCLFRCTVEEMLIGESVEIDDLYLYSDTPVHARVGDRYGEFEIDEICQDKIVFRNVGSIIFSGTCSILNDTITFEVSDNRRYAYLYTTETEGGTYKLEGTPLSHTAKAGEPPMILDGSNHSAFCYDSETERSYEELKVHFSDDLFIAAENATYTATVINGKTGFLGAVHRSFNPDSADLLGKILVDESEEVQIGMGESYVLDEGYILILRDIFVTGGTAWLELIKEGEVVESGVCIEGGTFEYELYVTGSSVTIFECTAVTIFQDDQSGFILLKDIRQCSDDVEKLNVGKKYGKFEVSKITQDRIVLTNTESITIDDETSILDGWLKFDVSGNRVTPYVEKETGGRI